MMDIKTVTRVSEGEKNSREAFSRQFMELSADMPQSEVMANLGLFQNRQALSRFLFMHELYRKIIPVHGVIVEFGCRWGQNMAWFTNLRGIYEPYNIFRKVIGFDTFAGFPSVHGNDLNKVNLKPGDYSVTEDYEAHLDKILSYHESECPVSHVKKYEIIKGDVTQTLEKYLSDNKETVIALAYFDMDIYEPTKYCLEMIQPYLTKGSVIGFDEVCHSNFPGETIALREVLGTKNISLQRVPYAPANSYAVME